MIFCGKNFEKAVVIIDFKVTSSVVEISHQLLGQAVTEGACVLDATAGNGNDTLFLADLVGKTGKVFAFDIQKEALDNTCERLKKAGMLDRVNLIQSGHENMDKYITEKLCAIIFNLGYLPGGDLNIITLPSTTVTALEKGTTFLLSGGLICIVVYWAHQGGKEEKEAVEKWVSQLSPIKWDVVRVSFPNRNMAPYVIGILKKHLEAE